MRPPAGYTVRPAERDDIGVIDGLLAAYDLATLGLADRSTEQLEQDFRTPGFDPGRDTWLLTADADGSLAGFALYKDRESGEEGSQGFGRVHPAHAGRGLGAYLIDAVDERWRTSEARVDFIRNYLTAGDDAASRLLASRGYRLVRREFHLARDLRELRPVEAPSGIQIRLLRPGEERELHAVNDESFAQHWGFRPSPFEEWSEIMDLPAAVPGGLVWVADDGGEMVGELVLMVQSEAGWVEALAVRPSWRGRGIGRALLRTGFAELARRGLARVLLGVDAGNETGALRLYEREGMTVRREWHVVEKRLD